MSSFKKMTAAAVIYTLLTVLMIPLIWKYPVAAVMLPLLVVFGLLFFGLCLYRHRSDVPALLSQYSASCKDQLSRDEACPVHPVRTMIPLTAAVICGYAATEYSYFTFNFFCCLAGLFMLLDLISDIITTFCPAIRSAMRKAPAIFRHPGIIIVLYIVLGALLPFVCQPEVSESTEENFDSSVFYSDEESGERAAVISQNNEALEERIRLISQAEERVILSTFEIDADDSGKMIMAALTEAADRGVNVCLIVDGLPYLTAMWGNPYFLALAQTENVEIRVYNQVYFWEPWTFMCRLHDKYLIVDDLGYILGGRNTYDFFLGETEGRKNYDWDVLVYSENADTDSSLDQVLDYFYSVWDLPVCRTMAAGHFMKNNPSVVAAEEELRQVYKEMSEQHPDWLEPVDYEEVTVPVNHIELVSNPTQIFAKEPVVFYTITELMSEAEESVTFHTPYIICNGWMLERLELICSEVDSVTMMTNSVANNGNLFGASDYDKNKETILETGVQILEYDGGISYHGKCFVIDDRLSGIGSFNWDIRSTYLDTELMLVIDSEELNRQLREEMQRYEDDALRVIDTETSVAPDGAEAQTVSGVKSTAIRILQLFGWLRFIT